MRIQKTLKDCLQLKGSKAITPNSLFTIFEDNIREFMGGIRDKLVEEIRQSQLITQKPLERRYSLDDYFLIDRVFSKSYFAHGFNNELFQHCSKYMNDIHQYEQIKSELRQRIWREVRKSNETIIALYDKPEAFRKIMDLIVRFYTRCREAVVAIEEMWIFLVEALFQQELRGNLIFEQLQKQLFKRDVLNGHRYIQAFIREVKDSSDDMLERQAQRSPENPLDVLIANLYEVLV